MFGRTEEKSWLEEELERERKGICVGETWWEKICRCVRGVFGKCIREAEKIESAYSYDELIEIPTYEGPNILKPRALDWDAHDALYKDGHITLNELRAMHGLPPVIGSDEELIFYADNRAVVSQNALNEALVAAKYGISAEEMRSRINQCIL